MKFAGCFLIGVAVLLALGVAVIDPTVPSGSLDLGRTKVYNSGLLASRDLLALLASTLFIAGAVLYAASDIVERLGPLGESLSKLTETARAPDRAPENPTPVSAAGRPHSPPKALSVEPGKRLGAVTKTEDYKGMPITFGYLGADVGGTYFKDKFEAQKAIDAGAFLVAEELVLRDGATFVWREQAFATEDEVRRAVLTSKI